MDFKILFSGLIILVFFLTGCTQLPQETTTTAASLKESTIKTTTTETAELKLDSNCDVFPDRLEACVEYKCQFTHPFTGEEMVKEILGMVDGRCLYVEEMPNNGQMECKYTEELRKAAVQYYRDLAAAESVGTKTEADLGSGETKTVYTINGKEVENPLQEALNNGQCIISGYE